MSIRNVYMAEWAGEYRWTDQAIPTELYSFAEDNVGAIQGLEGCHVARRQAGPGTVVLLTCRIQRPAELPGRPGVAYHHAIVSDTPADADAMSKAVRSKYRDPLSFARELYAGIASLGPDRTAGQAMEAAQPLMDSVAVDADFPMVPKHEVPPVPSPSATLNLMRLNAALLVLLIGLSVYQAVLTKKVLASLGNEMPGDTAHRVAPAPATIGDTGPVPSVTPAAAESHDTTLEHSLKAGGRYLLDNLPPDPDFLTGSRTMTLVSEIQQALRKNPGWHVLVEVYTDVEGGESANLQTSARRANALKELIRAGGNDVGARVDALGRGERETPPGNPPITSRQRRIVVSLANQPG